MRSLIVTAVAATFYLSLSPAHAQATYLPNSAEATEQMHQQQHDYNVDKQRSRDAAARARRDAAQGNEVGAAQESQQARIDRQAAQAHGQAARQDTAIVRRDNAWQAP